MIKRKKTNVIIIVSMILIVFMIMGSVIALYLTTDMFKPADTLFVKYLLQNVSFVEELARKESTGIQDALQNEKLDTNLTAKVAYTDNTGNKENSINQAEIDVSSQIDRQAQYDYKNIRIAYENQDVAKMEYLKNQDTYGIRLDGIMQFVSATNTNLDEVALKTGMKKEDLELLTYIFEPVTLSQFISYTPSEIQVLSSTYLGIIQQNTQKNQYQKSNQTIEVNGATYQAKAYSIKQTQEQHNQLVISILERVEKDIVGKLDTIEQQLTKYQLYQQEENKPLRDVVVEMIDDKIQDIKNHNIGQEETEITVYVYKGQTIRTLVKTPEHSMILDVDQEKNMQINYTQNLDNSTQQDIFTIEKTAEENAQNVVVGYHQFTDDAEKQGIDVQISKNKENDKMQNAYHMEYQLQGNVVTIDANEYMNIVEAFENQINFTQEDIVLDDLEQDKAQMAIDIMQENVNEKIRTILDHITLEDINAMLKNLGILKESEITFNEEPDEEAVTEVERNRFNSKLTFFIGKEVSKDTLMQLFEAAADCLEEAQIIYENEGDASKRTIRGIILDIKRNTPNDEKKQQLVTALTEEKSNEKYTVAMAFDETTRLINQITIVSNEFLEEP